ncbi:MAG: membrane protein FxsA, partial [Serratia liquefaciens]|nr:membrane protein FxsA [Serratia liquefaciens]
LLLLLPPVQKSLTLKLMPHLSVYRPGGWSQGGNAANGNTFDGEFQRKNDDRYTLDHQPDDHDKRNDR